MNAESLKPSESAMAFIEKYSSALSSETTRMVWLSAMSGFLGGGLGGGGAAQVGPVSTRNEVFAAHCAVGGFFDFDGAGGRHPLLGANLRDASLANAQQPRQAGCLSWVCADVLG